MKQKIGKVVIHLSYVVAGIMVIIGFTYLIITTIPTMLSEVNWLPLLKAIIVTITNLVGWPLLAIFLLTIHFKSKASKA